MSKPKRQEQEDASPEISEVAKDILRMQLPIQIPGLGHVHMYALVDRNGAAVIDPGLPGQSTWDAIVDRLKQAGLEPRHIHTVFITHSHPDHFGGAVRIHKESGAKIIAHRAFHFGGPSNRKRHGPVADHGHAHTHAHGHGGGDHHVEASVDDLVAHMDLLERDRRNAENPVRRIASALRRITTPAPWKGPADRAKLRESLRWLGFATFGRSRFLPTVTHHVEHGDVLKLAGREWFVQHTPGHTADHICLHDPETGAFLSGDHVLPSITPHIGGVSYLADPLKSFFYSLDRVGEIRGVELALPAHGHPFRDLAARAQSIKQHHHERLDEIVEIAKDVGRADVNTFMKRLFRERSWGDMAESETYAHLEHLRLEGRAEASRNEQGRLVYEI
ncbi:MAG TPA: MBL fold metallo-hydrolase [Myxococcota bacterium]|nr:MBL fold metallo-hydrolase [Myxococcota bacterium]